MAIDERLFYAAHGIDIEKARQESKTDILDRLSDEIKGNLYVDSTIFTVLYDFKNGKIDDIDEVIDKINHETQIEVLKIIEEFKKESEDSSISSKKAVNSIFGLPSITLQANASKLTNGDMMKIFFPDIEIEAVKMDDKIIGYDISKLDKLTYFTKSWWDAPYFVESEDEE